ncbi:hypothetical protein EYF80_025195 [Liparis tanakae]|uniref:Uncharacterized protein n=1 Tax=Liparis tanakae TaxID=230148 RepID=A0A4Z2HFC0_9TELE|nr:hypothetical protein EYF80_025195 [Liparis tanakae]
MEVRKKGGREMRRRGGEKERRTEFRSEHSLCGTNMGFIRRDFEVHEVSVFPLKAKGGSSSSAPANRSAPSPDSRLRDRNWLKTETSEARREALLVLDTADTSLTSLSDDLADRLSEPRGSLPGRCREEDNNNNNNTASRLDLLIFSFICRVLSSMSTPKRHRDRGEGGCQMGDDGAREAGWRDVLLW